MKTLKEIMDLIELPEIIQTELLAMEPSLSLQKKQDEKHIQNLTSPCLWESSQKYLKEALTPDKNGFKMLSYMLFAASYSFEKYKEKGISQQIFTDTMKCFTRFIEEHKESYGIYGFNRDFWTGRQLSLQLFRLGELEFETVIKNQKKMVSVHIPSDAILTKEHCKSSLEMAEVFFENYDSTYVNVPYVCHSWLLSPALRELLPESSNIMKFQNLFDITEIDKSSTNFLRWIFKKIDLPIENLPEDTTLQRNVKKYLMAGGQIGEGSGYMKKEFM
ncbi:MAG: DUF5596 domain-containing protein [Firmicutes bacterium]|nr:DUF5596 domain-containing protein [Bacillota bacterium]